MDVRTNRVVGALCILALGISALVIPACGGGGGGEAAGQGLILVNFSQDSIDNAVLNTRLRFEFSSPVMGTTINSSSIQIREGDQFGATVAGTFHIQGSTVIFEPVLASLCDQSDSGLKPDTEYRVQVVGSPAEFSVRNMAGQSLSSTSTHQFHTRLDTDPQKYSDQIPGVGPAVLSTSPANGDTAVAVQPGNQIEIVLSENVDPCSVNTNTVVVEMYESGVPGTQTAVPGSSPVRYSGFDKAGSVADQTPNDPYTWGADGTTSYAADPRRILCDVHLAQDFNSTRIVLTPLLGYNADPRKNASLFPENALIVVRLTFDLIDYGGLPMQPSVFAFTTQNLTTQTSEYLIENKGETPYIDAQTTAAIHPDPRAPERVQGYMLFAGDGDNGPDMLSPTLPQTVGSGCTTDLQSNDGFTDDFDPATDVVFDTGSTVNTCPNSTDGSTAVVWEFNSFRIRNGRTVRFTGVNPAIILVQGDVVIENGGRLLVYGDGQDGVPQGRGANAKSRYNESNYFARGGIGVAGGGDGGDSNTVAQAQSGTFAYGQDGFSGFGSTDYDPNMIPGGIGMGGEGTGGAGSPSGSASSSQYNPWDGGSEGGGGAGHAVAGVDGGKKQGSIYKFKKAARGFGGAVYGDDTNKLAQPEAGAGGGSSGAGTVAPFNTSSSYGASGAGGGSGGGFVDLTSSGTIEIFGSILAVGSRGGNGDGFSAYGASAGAGGGSGGAIRLLTPSTITVTDTAVISTAGGNGGSGFNPYSNAGNRNDGGDGGHGRIALEDFDSVIAGLSSANVTPGEGQVGFYRGIFDPGRFQGGGLEPKAVTELIPIGNYAGFNPTFLEPEQTYGGQTDFRVGIPIAGSPGAGVTALFVEARGYQMRPDGTADQASATGWVSIGYFRDSGVETSPLWFAGHPGDVAVAPDNTGGAGGFTELNGLNGGGHEFIQLRMTMRLPGSVGPFDPGAYLDDWLIRFEHDQ
ncbi:MAG: Ig-like domain-containing protein [Planctomycetota bacterium]|nr:Ig-like domain-containing protein [Planctomycetota bacterium]